MSDSRRKGYQLDRPQISECGKWLSVDLRRPHSILSWAIVGGGKTHAQRVVWHRVSNSDLAPDVDPKGYFEQQLARRFDNGTCVGFLTSAPLETFVETRRELDGLWALCVATVGLSNAVTIGDPPTSRASAQGTINILIQSSVPLSDNAAIEALSLVAEARTLAVLQGSVRSIAGDSIATGTGTDCIAIAAPLATSEETAAADYAGKHTALGHLIGGCTREAITQGVRDWKRRCLPGRA
jgi:adenosylcobinamide amidohydrolase